MAASRDTDRSGEAATEPILSQDDSDSRASITSASTTADDSHLPLWYRSAVVRTGCLACLVVLLLLNILSLSLERYKHCPLPKAQHIVSCVVYGVFLLLVGAAVLHSDKPAAASRSANLRLSVAVVSALCYLAVLALSVLGGLSMLVSRCEQRVYLMFVTTLDTATPLCLCAVVASYVVLSHIGQYRQKRDEGVDLSPLTPTAADPHLAYCALSTLVCAVNVAAVAHHSGFTRHHDTHALLSWVCLAVQAALFAALSVLLFLALLYRLVLTPATQHRLLASTLSLASQEVLVLSALLAVAWLVTLCVNSVLSVVFFALDVEIGGMAVVAWLNQLLNVATVAAMVWELARHWPVVLRYGEMAWLALRGEGMATGVYAAGGRESVAQHATQQQQQHQGHTDVV